MKNFLILSLLFTFFAANLHAQSSCEKAKEYEKKITDANENWTPDRRARNNCPQGWAQLGTWYAYKCECDKGVASKKRAEQNVSAMNLIRNTIKTQYPHCGEVPPVMTVDQIKITIGNKNNVENYTDPNSELKFAVSEFMNELSASTDNMKIKQISKNLNNTREWIDVFQSVDPENAEKFDEVEDVAMVITGIAGLFKKEEKEPVIKKKYWIDGQWKSLTEEQVKNMGLKVLKEPQFNFYLLEYKIRKRIGLSDKYNKRIKLLNKTAKHIDLIDQNRVNSLKAELYISVIEGNKEKTDQLWKELFAEFYSKESLEIMKEIEAINNEIKKLLVVQHTILRELFIQYYQQANPDWTKEEIIELKMETNRDKAIWSTDPTRYLNWRNVIAPPNYSTIPLHEFIDLKTPYTTTDFDFSQVSVNEVQPFAQYHGSLMYYRTGFLKFLLETVNYDSPFGVIETINFNKYNQLNGYNNEFLYLNKEKVKIDTSDAFIKSNSSYKYLYQVKHNKVYKSDRQEYLKHIESNIYETDIDALSKLINKYASKAQKTSPENQKKLKKYSSKYLSSISIKGMKYLRYKLAKEEINSFQLDKTKLSSLNTLITFLQAPLFGTKKTILENYVDFINHSDKGLPVTFVPFSRVFLFRYYLEKKHGITDHTERDAEFIRNNLNFVLSDFLIYEGNIEIAHFVLKELGIIE
jgi:hypothetical protein